MDNLCRLQTAFVEALAIDPPESFDALAYRKIPEWDSVAHMQLIGEIEEAFDVMLDTSDVVDLSSFAVAREILAKYGVTFDK